MPTLAQLQEERWWREEIQPPALKNLADRLCVFYGQPRVAAGIKGDQYHLRGSHRSRRWILRSTYCTSRTYTVTHPDDLAGDENWCSGLDFNPGSTERLIAICQRLDRAVRAGLIEEVSEWYGNVDGNAVVDGFDNVRNLARTSDSSHLWHLHASILRRYANDPAVMQRLYTILTGDDMEQTDALIRNPAKKVGDALYDVHQLRGWLVNPPGTAVPGAPPPGSVGALLVAAAQREPQPAPVDVAALAAELRPHLEAAAEAAVRKVLGSVDNEDEAPPPV